MPHLYGTNAVTRRISLARWLDPRPAAEAAAEPLADAVNIPAGELPDRMHELPPRSEEILVVGVSAHARLAVDWLRAHGRRARLETDVESLRRAPPASPPMRLWRPNAFLEAILPTIRPGTALDLACGTGRDAVYLAACGWRVVGMDVLPDALGRAEDLARRHGVASRVEWRCVDLESDEFAVDGVFDLVTCFRYLHRPLVARVPGMLRAGGHWVAETFTAEHRARYGKPRREAFVLAVGELVGLTPKLRVRHHSEDWRGENHTARLWAQKGAS